MSPTHPVVYLLAATLLAPIQISSAQEAAAAPANTQPPPAAAQLPSTPSEAQPAAANAQSPQPPPAVQAAATDAAPQPQAGGAELEQARAQLAGCQKTVKTQQDQAAAAKAAQDKAAGQLAECQKATKAQQDQTAAAKAAQEKAAGQVAECQKAAKTQQEQAAGQVAECRKTAAGQTEALSAEVAALKAKLSPRRGGTAQAAAVQEVAKSAFQLYRKAREQKNPSATAEQLNAAQGDLFDAQVLLAQTTDAEGVYKVRGNDTLSQIAGKFYGNGNRWNDIFKANQHLLDNANQLVNGMVLVMPR